MKKIILGIIALVVIFPVISFAQKNSNTSSQIKPQEPISLMAFLEKQQTQMRHFMTKRQADKDAFIKANPDAKAYIEQRQASAQLNSQTTQQAPASLIAYENQEHANRAAFFQQLKADRDAFFNANPDVKAYVDQRRALLNAQMAAKKTAHPPNNPTNSPSASSSPD